MRLSLEVLWDLILPEGVRTHLYETIGGAQQIMRIDYECSGGFANLRLAYRANSDELTKKLADKLLKLVEDSGIFDLQESDVAQKSTIPSDVLLYRISVSESGRIKSLFFTDVTAPEKVRPLLVFLQELSLKQTQKGK